MTEAEWLSCTEPAVMLDCLRGKTSDRKLRLFAIGFCKRIWNLFTDKRSRIGIEVAERFVDGGATREELFEARMLSHDAYMEARAVEARVAGHTPESEWVHVYAAPIRFAAYTTTCCDTPGDRDDAAECVIAMTTRNAAWPSIFREDLSALRVYQPYLLRCVFGNPFRPATIDPAWLTWHDGLIVSMARQMYESRDFIDMPILADALEEAGCTNQDFLGHCRSGGEHVRGCWVVDLLLGKE